MATQRTLLKHLNETHVLLKKLTSLVEQLPPEGNKHTTLSDINAALREEVYDLERASKIKAIKGELEV